MSSIVLVVLVTFVMPVMIILWNRQRVKGKMLCCFLRKDKSVVFKLCQLKGAFVIWSQGVFSRQYDVYPDFVRLARYPQGWPSMLQELVPAALYDEDDAIPKDWETLEAAKEGSMKLHAAMEERWVQKVTHEVSAPEAGGGFNWKRALPMLLIGIGVLVLLFLLTSKGCSIPGLTK